MTGHRAPVRRRARTGRYWKVSHSPFSVLLHRLSVRHGWRLYAIPVLLVVTLAALLPHRSTSRARADASVTTQTRTGAAPPGGSAPSKAGQPPAITPPTKTTAVRTASSSADATSAPSTATPTTAAPPTETPKKATSSKATSSQSAAPDAAYGQLIPVPPTRSSTACAHNTDRQHVFVSLADQHTWMCERKQLVRETVVTTGAPADHHATPRGTWAVQAKQADRVLNGPGYSQHVDYWVPFNGDFGFHDAAWQQMPFGTTGYRTLGSRGCVHLPTKQMTWFYHWVRVGASVTVTA